MRRLARVVFPAFVWLAWWGAPASAAEAPAADAAPEREYCLGLKRIDDSSILDSQHMLFTMSDKRLYLNTLPVACAGMRPGTTYTFRTSLTQLCQGDVVTILHPGGHDFIPGVSCVLGMFEQVTPAQLDALKSRIDANTL